MKNLLNSQTQDRVLYLIFWDEQNFSEELKKFCSKEIWLEPQETIFFLSFWFFSNFSSEKIFSGLSNKNDQVCATSSGISMTLNSFYHIEIYESFLKLLISNSELNLLISLKTKAFNDFSNSLQINKNKLFSFLCYSFHLKP